LTEPIILPTVTISVTLVTVIAVPLPIYLQPYLQPLAIIFIYGLALSVFSAGRIPKMLSSMVRQFLNIDMKSVEGR